MAIVALVASLLAVAQAPRVQAQSTPMLGGQVVNPDDWSQTVVVGGKATARFEYNEFNPGTYTIVSRLVDDATDAVVAGPATQQVTAQSTGVGQWFQSFDIPVDQAGATLRLVETVYAGSSATGAPLAVQAEDYGRTVTVSSGGGWQEVNQYGGATGAGTTVDDTVTYSGLKPSTTYTVVATTMDYANGLQTGTDSVTTVTSSASGSGTWQLDVPIPDDAAGKRLVVFLSVHEGSAVSGAPVFSLADLNDGSATVTVAAPGISQNLYDNGALPEGVVTDVITYSGLVPGREYALTVQPRNTTTSSNVGAPSSTTFTADPTGAGTVHIDVTAPREADGTTVTLLATVSDAGTVVASDSNETLTVSASSIVTDARDKRDFDSQVMAGDTIRDQITYQGFAGGQEYTVVSQLVSYLDGSPVGEQVTTQVTAGHTGAGTWYVDLVVPADAAQNQRVVVTQRVYHGTDTSVAPVASEIALSNTSQQVTVVGILPTPTTTVVIPSTVVATTTSPVVIPTTRVVTSVPEETRTSVVTTVLTSEVPVTVTREVTQTSLVTTVVPVEVTSTGWATVTRTVPETVVTTIPTTIRTTVPSTVTTPVTVTEQVVESSTVTRSTTVTSTSVVPSTTVVTTTVSPGGSGSLDTSGSGSLDMMGIGLFSAFAGLFAFVATVLIQSPQIGAALSSFLPAGVVAQLQKGA